MGKHNRKLRRQRYRLREEQRRREEKYARAALLAHARRDPTPPVIIRFDDFKPAYREKVMALRGYTLRSPHDWRCRTKSRSEDKRFLELVRFAFAHYRVPKHLERVWIDDFNDDFVDRICVPPPKVGSRLGLPDLRRWYLVVAQGGSLYKLEAHPYLSKQECHHFVTAPPEVTSARQAFWYAIARAQTDSKKPAVRVSCSKIANYSVASSYWKEVARFFARNPASLYEIDDFTDFLFVAKQQDAAFTLKGRTLETLHRRMEDWHRVLRRSNLTGGGAWAGSPLPDVEYETGNEHNKAIWRFRQIKTGNELYREGQRMHHCVAGYKHACLNGDVSIWSLTSEFPIGQINRGVTLEVTKDGRIVQCRGFANRLPYGDETIMVKRWASQNGLTWSAIER